jgi:hypothetical protein
MKARKVQMSDALLNGVQYFVIIAEQKKKNKFLSLLYDHGARGIEAVYGHGSMSPSAIAEAFGLEAEQGKVVISCLMKTENAKNLMEVLYRDYNFDKPNTGIAFGISIEGLAF